MTTFPLFPYRPHTAGIHPWCFYTPSRILLQKHTCLRESIRSTICPGYFYYYVAGLKKSPAIIYSPAYYFPFLYRKRICFLPVLPPYTGIHKKPNPFSRQNIPYSSNRQHPPGVILYMYSNQVLFEITIPLSAFPQNVWRKKTMSKSIVNSSNPQAFRMQNSVRIAHDFKQIP